MKIYQPNFKMLFVLALSGAWLLFANDVAAATNVNSVNYWAWNDIIGWVDLYSTNNVNVGAAGISGYANSSAVGYIAFDCATSPNGNVCGGAAGNWGIANNNGALSGYAWNDNIGWISFSGNQGGVSYGVEIDISGVFSGFAWNDIIGWISFNCLNDFNTFSQGVQSACAVNGGVDYSVKTSWIPEPGKTGVLFSSIFDTLVLGGAELNSIMWQGDQPQSTRVRFQIASSNCPNGKTNPPACNNAATWAYLGPNGSPANFYSPAGPGIAAEFTRGDHFNKRYFRYSVTLESNPARTKTPRVDNVIINWSR